MQYLIIIRKQKDSAFGVEIPSLPGCFSAADTFEAISDNAKEAIQLHTEGTQAEGMSLPSTNDQIALLQVAVLSAIHGAKDGESVAFAIVDVP